MLVEIYAKIFLVRKGVSVPPFFFHAHFLIYPSPFFRNMQTPPPLDTHHGKIPDSMTLESERLKTIQSHGNLLSIETIS